VGSVGSVLPTSPTSPTIFSRLRSAFKRVVGMPDYAGYLEHAREYHPDCPLLSEREYFDQYLAARYSGGGSRCC
jgi:uncharacterized short protein YbdD (DUF466 family)